MSDAEIHAKICDALGPLYEALNCAGENRAAFLTTTVGGLLLSLPPAERIEVIERLARMAPIIELRENPPALRVVR